MAFKRKDQAGNSSSIRVLHIINDLSVGGAEMMLYKLLSEIDRERFNCSVISLKDSGPLRHRLTALGLPVYTLKIEQALSSPVAAWRLIRLLRHLAPDVIQGWMFHGNLAALLAGSLMPSRVPVLWNIRQSLYSLKNEKPATAKIIRIGARLSDKPVGIIYNSRTSAAQHTSFGYRGDKSIVIYNGFDTNLFVPSAEARLSVRSDLGLARETILIGMIGRYHTIKNHPNFLHAAALLKKKRPDVRFILSGNGIDWKNRPLQALIQELGLTEHVHLLGEREDIARVIAAMDIVVSASNAEGFPNVIGEAMACAVPCVVTNVSDLSWIIKGAGLIVPKNSPAAMAHACAEMIELNAEGRRALGQVGRERVLKHFRLDAVVGQYRTIYESVARPGDCQVRLGDSRSVPVSGREEHHNKVLLQ